MEPRLPSSWLGAVLPSVTCAPIGPLRQASIIAAIGSGARQSPAPRRWRPIGFVPRRAAPGSPRCASSKAGNRHLAPGRDPEPENSLLRGDRGFESTSLQRRVIGRRWLVAGVPQNHQVVSFKSPADTPAMPGMLRKSTAFVPRHQKFESISLQRRDGMGQAARKWHHRRCSQLMECPDAPAERLEQVPRRPGPR